MMDIAIVVLAGVLILLVLMLWARLVKVEKRIQGILATLDIMTKADMVSTKTTQAVADILERLVKLQCR